jgi:hypothetical protein
VGRKDGGPRGVSTATRSSQGTSAWASHASLCEGLVGVYAYGVEDPGWIRDKEKRGAAYLGCPSSRAGSKQREIRRESQVGW